MPLASQVSRSQEEIIPTIPCDLGDEIGPDQGREDNQAYTRYGTLTLVAIDVARLPLVHWWSSGLGGLQQRAVGLRTDSRDGRIYPWLVRHPPKGGGQPPYNLAGK